MLRQAQQPCWGGTRLKMLSEELFKHGLAQENLGDIDVQSIAGAISTGTHGTGATFGTLAAQVVGLTLVMASGGKRQNSEEGLAWRLLMGYADEKQPTDEE